MTPKFPLALLTPKLKKLKRSRPPKWQAPTQVEREYKKILRAFLWELTQDIRNELKPVINSAIEQNRELTRTDSWVDDVQSVIARIKEKYRNITESELSQRILEVFGAVSTFNMLQFRKIVSASIGVNPIIAQNWLPATTQAFIAQNVSLITKMTQTEMDTIGEMVLRNVQKGLRYEELSKEIEKQMDISRNRADLIARDQVEKLNGQLSQLRQQSIGGKRYIWRTAMDERVRSEHEDREGKEFSWDDPPDDGHPGEPINCRCYAEMIFDDILGDE